MKRIIYIISGIVLLCSCNGYIGGMDDSNNEFTQLVFINRSSLDIKVSIDGADWITPQDTIRLKPENGLYKTTKYDSFANFQLQNSIMHVDFGNGREICFDSESCFPHNPARYTGKQVYDSKGSYIIVEFSDEICEEIFKYHDQQLTFKMGSLPYPNLVVDSLCMEGSSEAHFLRLYATPQTRKSLRLGAVVSTEADSVNEIDFMEDCEFAPDSVEVYDSAFVPEVSSAYGIQNSYYSLENLRKFSLAHFGCDFVALTGRAGGQMERFCGLARVSTYIDHQEWFRDREPSEEFLRAYESSGGKIAAVSLIAYGNIRILLAEANSSLVWLYYHMLYDVPDGSQSFKIPEGVEYHLITLDKNGEFTCRSGGEELAHEFESEYDAGIVHPICFSLTDFSSEDTWIHIPDLE